MMKHLHVVLALLVGAPVTAHAAVPRVVHHPTPALSTTTVDVERYGCHAIGKGDERGNEYACSEDSPIGKLGCSRLWSSPILSGVTPAEPVLGCEVVDRSHSLERSDYVLASGGMMPSYTRYLALSQTGPLLLRSAASFRERYAPVDSPAEALTFATALTGLTVFAPKDPPENLRYFLRVLEDTEVVPTPAGYLVKNLSDTKLFGCGPHPTSLVDVEVSRDGTLKVVNERKAFEDPEKDNLCVD